LARTPTAAALTGAAARVNPNDFDAQVRSWHRSLRVEYRSPLTILSYDKTTRQLLAFLEDQGMPRSVEHIRREHIEAFIEHLRDAGKAEATIAQHWRNLKAWFNWLAGDDRINASPMRRMKAPTVTQKQVPVLTDDEIARLLTATEGRAFTDRRDRALIALFLTTGLRLAEMASLVYPEDLDLDDRLLHVMGKGKRERDVKYTNEAAKDLDRYLMARERHARADSTALWVGQDGPMTPSGIYQAVTRRAKTAGVDMHPHMTRHTFAAAWLDNGGSEQDLLEQAGWSSPQMLLRYGRATRAQRRNNHYDTFAPRLAKR
jgi:integrase/recombinase XerD